ncbi:hypothetical protein [Streptomyces tendae]|uniref:hypothetical protein n=1 Tax=Streptomyces tendae TaxID=1932 RepID=UPI003D704CBB
MGSYSTRTPTSQGFDFSMPVDEKTNESPEPLLRKPTGSTGWKPGVQPVYATNSKDAPLEAQQLVNELLAPTPERFFTDPLDTPAPRGLGVPSTYIVGEHDQAFPRPEAEYARRVGLEPITVFGTPENLLTHPDELAKATLNV